MWQVGGVQSIDQLWVNSDGGSRVGRSLKDGVWLGEVRPLIEARRGRVSGASRERATAGSN